MRLPRFEYHAPASADEALRLLDEEPGATVLAGGTDLPARMKQGGVQGTGPPVSIRRKPELREIHADHEAGLLIGAAASLTATWQKAASLNSETSCCHAISEACRSVGAWQHREMGTIGGNLCVDTRCVYFDQPGPLREATGKCYKTGGDRCHVLKGSETCASAYCGDTAPALMVLGARLTLLRRKPDGDRGGAVERVIDVEEFFTGDGKGPNVLRHGELLAQIHIPAEKTLRDSKLGSAYLKLRPRGAIDFPQVGVAAFVRLDQTGTCVEARLALTGVSSAPRRVRNAEEMLAGTLLDERSISLAAACVYEEIRPIQNIKGSALYRRTMARALTEKVLRLAHYRAREQ